MMSKINLENIVATVSLLFLLTFSFLPMLTLAAPSPGEKSNPKATGITYECGDASVGTAGNCDFDDLIRATRKAINYIVVLAIGFSVVVIAYAGFNYMISADSPGAKKKANDMLLNAVIGIAWIMGAWLVVTLIASALLGDTVLTSIPTP